jgi:integrase
MPRPDPGPRLILYGPDARFGAKEKKSFRRYVWYIIWRQDGEKREQSTGVERIDGSLAERRAADQALENFLVERRITEQHSSTGVRGARERTISEVLATYALEHGSEVADPARLGYALKPLARFWGDQFVSAIDKNACKAYVAFRQREFAATEQERVNKQRSAGKTPKPARDFSPATARRELGVLQAAMKHCNIQDIPAVLLPEHSVPRERWLTRSEAARLLRQARKVKRSRKYLPLFILLSLYHGHRRGAVTSLRWKANSQGGYVDLERGIIDFRKRSADDLDRTKDQTKKRRSVVPIHNKARHFLERAEKKAKQFVVGPGTRQLSNPNRGLATAAKAAGLGRITSHTLRHTAITWLVRDGVPLWQVAGWVGTSVEMIEKVYGHHDPSQYAEIMGRKSRSSSTSPNHPRSGRNETK